MRYLRQSIITVRERKLAYAWACGQANVEELAGYFNISVRKVSQILGTPHVKHYLQQLKSTRPEVMAAQILKQSTIPAAESVVGLLNSRRESVRLAAAREILERAGVGPGVGIDEGPMAPRYYDDWSEDKKPE